MKNNRVLLYITLILILLLGVCIQKALPQNIGVGIGVTSRGSTCATFAVNNIHKFGIYTKFVNDELESPDNCGDKGMVGVNYDEWTVGGSYMIHPDVSLIAGVGISKMEICNNPEEMVRDYSLIKGFIYEFGFSYTIMNLQRMQLNLNATMSNYSGVSSVVQIAYKIK